MSWQKLSLIHFLSWMLVFWLFEAFISPGAFKSESLYKRVNRSRYWESHFFCRTGNCPEGSGAVFESSCFFIIDIPTASWNYARWTCENYGADLAVIKSVNENNVILNLVTNQPTVQALGVWIGLQRDFFQDYAFYWVDDTPLEYSAWAESQPSSTREECVHTVTEGQENGKWNDNYCVLNGRVSPNNFPFILCQKSI